MKLFKGLFNIFTGKPHPPLQSKVNQNYIDGHLTPLQRKAIWYKILDDVNWTCKDCGTFSEDSCKNCRKYRNYIIHVAPYYSNAEKYFDILNTYHKNKVFSWEDYEK